MTGRCRSSSVEQSPSSAPGKPKLKVVGIAISVTSADLAWVVPSQLAALRPINEPALEQMLYTFARDSTPQQIDADLASCGMRCRQGR